MQPVLIIASVLVLSNIAAEIESESESDSSLQARIVGGSRIDIESVPFQVSVRRNNKHLCGGSIVAADKILTAAHCTQRQSYTIFSIRVGSDVHYKGELFGLRGYYQHPKFDAHSISNDFCMLYLKTSLTYGTKIQPIQLAAVRPNPGKILSVSGWGTVHPGVQVPQKYLRAVDIPLVSQEDCISAYPSGEIFDSMLCAGSTGKDACQGDSGGPLFDFETFELVGIVSWGYGCGFPDYPGVYASVPDGLDFIQDALNRSSVFETTVNV